MTRRHREALDRLSKDKAKKRVRAAPPKPKVAAPSAVDSNVTEPPKAPKKKGLFSRLKGK